MTRQARKSRYLITLPIRGSSAFPEKESPQGTYRYHHKILQQSIPRYQMWGCVSAVLTWLTLGHRERSTVGGRMFCSKHLLQRSDQVQMKPMPRLGSLLNKRPDDVGNVCISKSQQKTFAFHSYIQYILVNMASILNY